MIVVKQLPIVSFGDLSKELIERFINSLQHEFDMLKVLQHRNLVQYHGAIIRNGLLEIVQEYVPSRTLGEIIKTKSLLNNE